jgi:hypothetical protein
LLPGTGCRLDLLADLAGPARDVVAAGVEAMTRPARGCRPGRSARAAGWQRDAEAGRPGGDHVIDPLRPQDWVVAWQRDDLGAANLPMVPSLRVGSSRPGKGEGKRGWPVPLGHPLCLRRYSPNVTFKLRAAANRGAPARGGTAPQRFRYGYGGMRADNTEDGGSRRLHARRNPVAMTWQNGRAPWHDLEHEAKHDRRIGHRARPACRTSTDMTFSNAL